MFEIIKKLGEEAKRIGRGIKNLRFFQFAHLKRFWQVWNKNEKIAFTAMSFLVIAYVVFMSAHFYITHTKVVPAFGGSYTEALVGQPEYINPLLAQSQTDKDITELVYAGLYKLDDKGQMAPDLAADMPEISADGKQYTIKLKPNLKWSDGQPITADDVIFTIETLQNPDYKSPLAGLWQNISIKKIDDLTVQFSNKYVSAPFITNLTLGIIPEHVWSKIQPEQFLLTKYNLEPVGSGPYFIKEIKKLQKSGIIQSMSLESYSNYWEGKPMIDTINFNFYDNYQDALFALHSKEVQGLGSISFDQKNYVDPKTSLNVEKDPVFEYQAVFFNLAKSHNVLGDLSVRQALAQSLNRQDVINSAFGGFAVPAYGPIMPEQLGYNPDIEKMNAYNVAAANNLLDQSGWAKDPKTGMRSKGGQALAFAITTNDFPMNVDAAKNLQEQWAKIGANISVNIVPTADFTNSYIRPRNFDALLFAESTGSDPDPFVFWHSSQSANPGYNIAQYKNQFTDRLISDARNTFDPSVRADKYKQFQAIEATDIPAIFIAQAEFVYQTGPELKGMQIQALANPEDRFYDVEHWYVNTRRIFK